MFHLLHNQSKVSFSSRRKITLQSKDFLVENLSGKYVRRLQDNFCIKITWIIVSEVLFIYKKKTATKLINRTIKHLGNNNNGSTGFMASRRLANFYQAHSDFRKAQGHFLRGNKFFTKFLDVFDNISMNFQPLSFYYHL